MIFLYLQTELLLFKIIKLRNLRKKLRFFLAVVQLGKSLLFRFRNFTMLQKQEKSLHLSRQSNKNQKVFQTCPLKLTSMLSKVLQNQEQMRLNIGKKLKTASLNSRFTGSKKKECTSTCSLLKNFET